MNTKLAVRIIGNLEAFIASVAFAVMITVVSANVIVRFATGTSLVFTEEIAYLGFGYSVFFCISWIYRMRGMIAVDLVVDALPAKLQTIANILCYAVLTVANAYFFYLSAKLAGGGWVRKTAFLEIPYFWVNLAPTVAFGLMTLYSAWFLHLLFRHQELPSVELEQQV